MPPHRSGISKSVGVSSPPRIGPSRLSPALAHFVFDALQVCAWFRVLTCGSTAATRGCMGGDLASSDPGNGLGTSRWSRQTVKERSGPEALASPCWVTRWSEYRQSHIYRQWVFPYFLLKAIKSPLSGGLIYASQYSRQPILTVPPSRVSTRTPAVSPISSSSRSQSSGLS